MTHILGISAFYHDSAACLVTNGDLVAALSQREFEVFRLLADSKSVNEIADLLSLSPKTVGHHMTHIKSKLNVSNIAGLTRLAIRLGIITP